MHYSASLVFSLFLTAGFSDGAESGETIEGHSHQGHAFNEGPRQAGPLMGNTGEVHFPVTTKWDQGQAYFDQGIGQLHGFWYYEAERSFRQVLAKDPDCLMAYWGLAMANFENPKRAAKFLEGFAPKIEEAPISEREKKYLRAEIRFYDEGKVKDSKARSRNYLKDMEDLILEFPEDLEAKAFYVCRAWQFNRKGVPISSYVGLDAILEQIFSKDADHPAHHFAIHLWDYRSHEQALDSAAILGKTAPGIAHMWHMPGHIYSKAKRFEDAAWHQQASARIDHGHMKKHLLSPDQIHNYAHNNEWLSRTFADLGRASEAVAMAKSLLANPRHPKFNTPAKGSTRYGRSRLMQHLETFELWGSALALTGSDWLPAEDDPSQEASRLRLIGVSHFHFGQRAGLEEAIEKLEEIQEKKLAEEEKAETEAREKAEKEKKSEKEVKAAEKKAKDQHQRVIKGHEKMLGELRGYLAELSGDLATAEKAIGSLPNTEAKMARQLALGNREEAAKMARDLIAKDDKKCPPLAKAIFVLHQVFPDDPACREGFEKLRKASSQIEITSPIFARLAPVAEALGYPSDWRVAREMPEDLLVRPELDSLGPLHWTPPSAPTFSLPNEDGRVIALKDYRGQPVILVFYLGAGCLHCVEQLTLMADRYDDFEKAGLPILAVSTDEVSQLHEARESYEADGSEKKIPFELLSDAKMEIFREYTAYDDFEAQPLHGTFLVDGRGRVLWGDVSAEPFMDVDFLIKESTRLLRLHP